MLDTLRDIAPLVQWFEVLTAAGLLLLGFVAYGHYRVVTQAFGQKAGGAAAVLSPARAAVLARWTVLFLALGFALWGLALDWTPLVVGGLLALALAALVADMAARLRG